jgi:phospholipid/cholesterol/gamma-HCH transport system substrate-binding protein
MKKGLSTNAKVGVFVFIVLIVLSWITFKISSGTIFGRSQGYAIKAYFTNAQGLNAKTGVYLAGIKIGFIDDIKLVNDKALVVMNIMSGVKIEENAKAVIRTKGLLGEEYIEIIPGAQSAGLIKPGEELSFAESPPDMEELMNKLNSIATNINSVTQSLSDVFGGTQGTKNIKGLFNNLNETINHVDHLITSTNSNLNKTFASVHGFTDALKEHGPDIVTNLAQISEALHQIIAENSQSVNKTMENINAASQKLDTTLANVEVITNDLKEGKGTIGKLLADKKTEEQVSNAISGISSMVGGISKFRIAFNFNEEYQFHRQALKSYLNLILQPTPDSYFLLGIVDDPSGYASQSTNYTSTQVNNGPVQQTQTVTKKISNQLKFNAEIAKKISYVTFRGGIIESSGGVGIDVDTPFEPFWLSVDMYNFNARPHPTLKATLSTSLLRYFILSGGMVDILNQDWKTWFVGVGLGFNDEDIKSFFGLASSTSYANTK